MINKPIPQVSILMAVHNEELYIRNSIDSILSQTYENFELIIINDGSNDGTHEIISSYADNRIKYFKNERIGKVEAFNIAYSKSRGKYICCFAGDDVMFPENLKLRFESINNQKDFYIATSSKFITISKVKKYDNIVIPKSNLKGSLSGGALMFNKNLAEYIFPIPNNLPNEDVWMKLCIEYFKVKIVHNPQIMSKYRIHQENSFLNINSFIDFKEKSKKYHIRRILPRKIFIEKYNDRLSKENISEIKNFILAEDYRYNKKYVKLLFSKISCKNKIIFLFESSDFMYKIKNRFNRCFMGYG